MSQNEKRVALLKEIIGVRFLHYLYLYLYLCFFFFDDNNWTIL